MNYKEEFKNNQDMSKELYEACPDMMGSFMNMHGEYAKDSTITLKEKEMVSIGISITIKCIPCMLAHITSLKKAGGTREELVDVIKACILMNGGPGTAYGAKALKMFDELD